MRKPFRHLGFVIWDLRMTIRAQKLQILLSVVYVISVLMVDFQNQFFAMP